MAAYGVRRIAAALIGVAALVPVAANAGPWINTGDAQARSDVEVLAASGVIDNSTTQWPLPWRGLAERLQQPGDLAGQPGYVIAAANRLMAEGEAQTKAGDLTFWLTGSATNLPATVRGFDAMGIQDVQSQFVADYEAHGTTVHLAVGAQTTSRGYLWNGNEVATVPGSTRTGHRDGQILLLDGSYVAQRVGNAILFGGYLSQWWGAGWMSALSLSNNARPFPLVGIMRDGTAPFKSPWLSWIGPWQAEFFVGLLDGPRLANNTVFNGLRFSFEPVHGLEFGLSRTEELCGTGHPCQPIAEFINVQNNDAHPSKSKDETNFDLRYTNSLGDLRYAVYAQVMDRDTGPFVHSFSSHLFGASLYVPVERTAVRFTAEYANTISTMNFFDLGKYVYGITYTDYKYIEGWNYRGRTMGSSLDTDSQLSSLQASWVGPRDIGYTLTYHYAVIGNPHSANINTVTTTPVAINIGEVRVRVPFSWGAIDLDARVMSDQPRPDHGFTGAFEAAYVVKL